MTHWLDQRPALLRSTRHGQRKFSYHIYLLSRAACARSMLSPFWALPWTMMLHTPDSIVIAKTPPPRAHITHMAIMWLNRI